MNRIEQAAYDVLFNKANWRQTDTRRRDVWKPLTGTSSSKGDIFVTQGMSGGGIQAQVLDQFASYPLHLEAVMTDLPEGWWPPTIQGSSQSGK